MKIPDDPLDLPAMFRGLKVTDLSVLDLGSGRLDSPLSVKMRSMAFHSLTLVEGFQRSYRDLFYLDQRGELAAKHRYIHLKDVKTFYVGRYDVITMLDIIEHLPKDIGLRIINNAQENAYFRILIWLPIGVCPQGDLEGNPLQVHQSTWEAKELEDLGFQVKVYKNYHTHFNPHVSAAWAVWDRVEYSRSLIHKEEAPAQYEFMNSPLTEEQKAIELEGDWSSTSFDFPFPVPNSGSASRDEDLS